jgi:putative phosphoesterase
VELVVLADTHLRAGLQSRLSARAIEIISAADVILHAGDVMSVQALDELEALAPVHAVLGNNDGPLAGRLPERLVIELAGLRIALVHDSGRREGRAARLAQWFPSADLVVFGHSHVPWHEVNAKGQISFNPGSATERRSEPRRTLGRATVADGVIERLELVEV